MTKDDIIRMAREAGMVWASGLNGNGYHINHPDDIERFASLVAAAEREACAKVCDEMASRDKLSNYYAVAAKAIRERGNT